MAKVLVGMSGGVDSSAAALKLLEEGHEVVGCTLLLRPGDGCGSQNDIDDARAVCAKLGIEHIAPDMTSQFKEKVIDKFCSDYMSGRTPNPCVECNRFVKFGAMLEFALSRGFDCIATGHYAKIKENNGVYTLHAVKYKDQSYFLYRLTQHQLRHTLFPLADCEKDEIREKAKDAGLPVHAKRDSQDVCFIPDGKVSGYLRSRGFVLRNGLIIDESGKKIGIHCGAQAFTIGQRKGLGGGFPQPMFVLKTDVVQNTVTIGPQERLFSSVVRCQDASFVSGTMPLEPFDALVKLRFASKAAEAVVTPFADGTLTITFKEAQRAPTPGQSAVFYNGDMVLGGAIIM